MQKNDWWRRKTRSSKSSQEAAIVSRVRDDGDLGHGDIPSDEEKMNSRYILEKDQAELRTGRIQRYRGKPTQFLHY